MKKIVITIVVFTACFASLIIFTNQKLPQTDIIPWLSEKLANYQKLLPREKLYLHFDRTMYKPGDDVWFKVYLRQSKNLSPSSISEIVKVALIDPKGNTIKKLELIAREGNARGDFHLDNDLPGGIYQVKAYTQWMQNFDDHFSKEIQVQAVILPRLRMKLDFQKENYGPGQQVSAILDLQNLENQALKDHSFKYMAKIDQDVIEHGQAQTDQSGKAAITFLLPDDLTSTDGLLNIMIDYQQSIESISRAIPIVLHQLDLQFMPEGGQLVENIPGRLGFKALDEFGQPADIEGVIYDDRDQEITTFSSFHMGMGALDLIPETGRKYYARLIKPKGIHQVFDLPVAHSRGYSLKLTKHEPTRLEFDINNPLSRETYLTGQVRGQICFTQKIDAKPGIHRLKVSLADFPAGVAQFTLWDYRSIARCERLVFLHSDQQLNIRIKTDKAQYLPREKVNLNLQVTDPDGLPVSTSLSLAVADDNLLTFADDKQDHMLSWLWLSSELKGAIKEPGFYFEKENPKAAEALDYLLMTQGYRQFTWRQVMAQDEADWKNLITYQPEQAIVKGRVINARLNKPVEGVMVTVLETEEVAYTDQDGYFEFRHLDLSFPRTLKAQKGEEFSQVFQVNDYSRHYLLQGQLTGIVQDEQGQALPGVNVFIKQSGKGAVTDLQGHFKLDNVNAGDELVVSSIGYVTEYITLNGQNHLKLNLETDVMELEEMVVIGYANNQGWDRKMKIPEPVRRELVPINEEADIKPQPVEQLADEAEFRLDLDVQLEDPYEEVVFEDRVMEEEPVNDVFVMAEEMPAYKGGLDQFYQFLTENLVYPAQALHRGISGKIFVQFLIDQKGNLKQPHILKGIHPECDQAVLDALQQSPAWKPGKHRKQPVEVRMVLPVNFTAETVGSAYGLMIEQARGTSFSLKSQPVKYYRARTFYAPQYTGKSAHPELRDDFRSTIYWNPAVQTDQNGQAELSFYNSDQITTFKIVAEGISQQGTPGRQEYRYHTQLPFALSTKIPEFVLFQDQINIPVWLRNNTDRIISGVLKVDLPQAINLLKPYQANIRLNPGQNLQVVIQGEVLNMPGLHGIDIYFQGDQLKDAIHHQLKILPKGFPLQAAFSSNSLSANYQVNVSDLVPHSMEAELVAYPHILSDLMSGVESILSEPYGCFEQTSSSTYPNIIALQYLKEQSTTDPVVEKRALDLIEKGYKKLISFETSEKGYEWFGSTPPHEALTAYGLMEFKEMEQVYARVDEHMVQRTTRWLLQRKDGLGGFLQDEKALDQFGRASRAVNNAYIVYAITEAGQQELGMEIQQVIRQALNDQDAYQLALALNAGINLDLEKQVQPVRDLLDQVMAENLFGQLPADHSITRSSGKSLQVETAALIILGYMKATQKDWALIRQGIDYLVSSRQGGGFGSTQATILALKAMTEYARNAARTAEAGEFHLRVNGKHFYSKPYAKDQTDEIRLEDFASAIKQGSNQFEISFSKTGTALPYSLNLSWTSLTPSSDPDCKVALDLTTRDEQTVLGQTVRYTYRLINKTSEGLPMTVVRIGIPGGLSVQPWQLKQLMEQKSLDFYEIRDNYLVIYYRDLAPGAEHIINLDLKTEIPGVYEGPASSAYLYYTNEKKDWVKGSRIRIKAE